MLRAGRSTHPAMDTDMRILVTGGTGSVGQAAVARLVCVGHSVLVIGRRTGMDPDGAEYVPCDICDYATLCRAMDGCDAVVHLAAIPSPKPGREHDVFRVNVSGTFNVFQAAADNGIKRVVQASSINALGANFGRTPVPVRYLPIDEEHPALTTDEYSLSKDMVEDIGEYFWRRDGISSAALRLPWVMNTGAPFFGRLVEAVRSVRERLQEVLDGPAPAREALVENVEAQLRRLRSLRAERQPTWHHARDSIADPLVRALVLALPDFCTIVDDRDSAQSIDRALGADYEGAHALFINDGLNTLGVESETLARVFFADVTARKHPLRGRETLLSIDRARSLIGYEPAFPLDA